jgi:hypothetical protein
MILKFFERGEDMKQEKVFGFFGDVGAEINPDLIRKPDLCVSCRKDDYPEEEVLCTLTRADQEDDQEFLCEAFKPK